MSADEIKAKLVLNIRLFREKKGISQRRMARLIDMDPGAYNRVENGSGNLRVDTVVKISEALQVDPSALFGEANEDFAFLWSAISALSPERTQRLKGLIKDLLLAQELSDSQQKQ